MKDDIRLASLILVLAMACSGGDPAGAGGRNGNGSGGSGAGASDSAAGSGASGAGAGGGFANADPNKPPPDNKMLPPTPNPEAFWAMDPPPMQCLQDGTMKVIGEPPGGTLDCPSDKNREGCACEKVGATAACWPGLRANRNRGDCQDGTTTCEPYMEFGGAWGECQGEVLPNLWVKTGPAACRCFSEGTWELDNMSPCFITDPRDSSIYAVSTSIDASGMSGCPVLAPINPLSPPAPPSAPPNPWTTNQLTVDCAGHYKLCYSIKAGDGANPTANDCVLVKSCATVWYQTAGVKQELPDLPGWASPDAICAKMFQDGGGYGEMTVKGLSVECDEIDDGTGAEYVFNRRGYCPAICNTDPMAAGCARCVQGGSGMF